jgi:hypothetical protein
MMVTLQGWGTNLLLAMVSSFAEVLVVGTEKILSLFISMLNIPC